MAGILIDLNPTLTKVEAGFVQPYMEFLVLIAIFCGAAIAAALAWGIIGLLRNGGTRSPNQRQS